MEKILDVGLDVHNGSIVMATAPQDNTQVQPYCQSSGTLDALDKLIKNWNSPEMEIRQKKVR